jgi:hypothetical protein
MFELLKHFPDQTGVQHGPYLPLDETGLQARQAIPGRKLDEQALHQYMGHATAVTEVLLGDRISSSSAEILYSAINDAMENVIPPLGRKVA